MTAGTFTRDGDGVPGTRIEKSAVTDGGALRIADSAGTRSTEVHSPYTLNWALFDAVQRLPRQGFSPVRFTLLDDLDEPKPGVTLALGDPVELMLGGVRVQETRYETLERGRIRQTYWAREGDQPVRFHTYHLVGPGTVPWIYYVDPRGRLTAAVAGLEAYLLEPQPS
jgi:hypothetical protein